MQQQCHPLLPEFLKRPAFKDERLREHPLMFFLEPRRLHQLSKLPALDLPDWMLGEKLKKELWVLRKVHDERLMQWWLLPWPQQVVRGRKPLLLYLCTFLMPHPEQ